MDAATTAGLDRGKVYVVYCDGIGCNASTKGAYKLAGLGFRAKELLGGIDWWCRDGRPVAASHEPASLLAAESGQSQRIGTRGAPSVPLKERADLQPG